MRLRPYVAVNGLPFSARPEDLLQRLGPPPQRQTNAVALDEWDYGHTVYRFQARGRLEEVTADGAVLHLGLNPGEVAVPFAALAGFIAEHDRARFERAGYLVSPALGLAFVPGGPPWVTALARHGIPIWRAMPASSDDPGAPP